MCNSKYIVLTHDPTYSSDVAAVAAAHVSRFSYFSRYCRVLSCFVYSLRIYYVHITPYFAYFRDIYINNFSFFWHFAKIKKNIEEQRKKILDEGEIVFIFIFFLLFYYIYSFSSQLFNKA